MFMRHALIRASLAAALVKTVAADFAVLQPGTIANTSNVALSSGCVRAMEATLQCDEYLEAIAAADIYAADNSTQVIVCTTDCSTSLASYIRNVDLACANDLQAWSGLNHDYYGKVLQSTYNMTCLKDPSTGQFCTDYLLNLGTGVTTSDLSLDQACSPCMLGIAQQIQATPYSNYDEDLAVEWTNLQERCGVNYPTGVQLLQTNVTDPPGYVTNYTTATYCLSGNTYTVVSGDSCGAIAAAQGVATGSLITLNNVLPDCTNLQVGQSLCIPQTCTTYIVQSGDTCFAIATAHNITFTQLRSYNPTINPTCTNLIAGNNICLTLPGGEVYNGTTIAGATPTQTGSYATATVTPPGSVAYGTTTNCGKYYQVVSGDYCQIVALKNSITLELFEAINPSIDATCSNLTPDVYYCVFPTENWNQTITTTAYTTAPAPAPTESGASDACYTWYVVVSGDTCSKIESSYGITSDEFAVWNPAVDADCTNLQIGEAYCVDANARYNPSAVTTSTTTSAPIVTPTPHQDGMVAGCTSFYYTVSGDTCYSVATAYGISTDTFISWNPAVGTDCGNLWLSEYYCVAAPASATTSKAASTTSSAAVVTPTPYQPNMIAGCKTFHLAVSGDYCYLIASDAGIDVATLQEWNPDLGSDCTVLLGYYYCIGL